MASTNEMVKPFGFEPSTTSFRPGPIWTSFEAFRTVGSTGLQTIPEHGVATLRTKNGTYRVLRDVDFQRLLGLATEIHRLQGGLRIVMNAAKVFAKHRDQEHEELLLQSVSLLAECPVLPERSGHDSFELTEQDRTEYSSEDLDLETAEIPRPKL